MNCPNCNGRGTEADYVGLEMKCVEVECSKCNGTGVVDRHNREILVAYKQGYKVVALAAAKETL